MIRAAFLCLLSLPASAGVMLHDDGGYTCSVQRIISPPGIYEGGDLRPPGLNGIFYPPSGLSPASWVGGGSGDDLDVPKKPTTTTPVPIPAAILSLVFGITCLSLLWRLRK